MLKTNSRPGLEVLLVEVPDGINDFAITKTKYDYWLSEVSSIPLPPWQINLPYADWKILSTTDEITESQMKEICEPFHNVWTNYEDYDWPFNEVIRSWQSLLTSLKADSSKRYLVLINKK